MIVEKQPLIIDKTPTYKILCRKVCILIVTACQKIMVNLTLPSKIETILRKVYSNLVTKFKT